MDLDFVRSQFPAFEQPSLKGQAFFENAGGSYTCRQVIDRLFRFYTEHKVQPYAPYAASEIAGAEMDEARARLSALLGVTPQELSFGPSTTANTYVLAQAFRKFLKPGEKIIVTNQDHEANSGPWRRLAEDGIEVLEWGIDPATGHLDPATLEPMLDESVRLVCFPHCSNVVGEINPVTEITALAHAAGAFVCVDGVSYAPHGLPNVGELGPDIYLFSAYKTYGPHQGIMVINKSLAELLPNQAHYFNADVPYKRFTPAGPDHAQVAACAGMVDYFEALAAHHGAPVQKGAGMGGFVHDLMRQREIALLQPLLDAVKDRNDVRLLGPSVAEDRAPTGPVVQGRAAGGGDFYAVRALRAMGVDPDQGVLRLSFTHYTSETEVTQLIEALDRVL